MTTIRKRPLRASASLFPASASMLQSRRRLNVCDSSIYTAPALVTLCKWAHHFGWWIVPCGFFPHGTMPRQPGTFTNFSNTVKTKTQVNSRSLSSPLGRAPARPGLGSALSERATTILRPLDLSIKGPPRDLQVRLTASVEDPTTQLSHKSSGYDSPSGRCMPLPTVFYAKQLQSRPDGPHTGQHTARRATHRPARARPFNTRTTRTTTTTTARRSHTDHSDYDHDDHHSSTFTHGPLGQQRHTRRKTHDLLQPTLGVAATSFYR